MENNNRLRIVLADPQYLFRRGLRAVLCGEPDLEILGEVSSIEECVAFLRSNPPDAMVIHVSLASEPVRATLRELNPSLAFVLVADESWASCLNTCGELFVLQSQASTHIAGAIRQVCGRMQPLASSSSRTADDLRALAKSTNHFSTVPGLTVRESEIVKILSEGRTAREVAEELGLSIKTVEAHKLNVMRKLGVHNRISLIRYAAQYSTSEVG